MKEFRNGVKWYTTAIVPQLPNVYFPEDDVCCIHCQWCYKDTAGRYMCRLLSQELYYVNYGIRENCPLIFEEGENDV